MHATHGNDNVAPRTRGTFGATRRASCYRPGVTTLLTDSPLPILDAEAVHRRHAIIEQVIADLKSGPLAHLPSARFNANGAC